MSVQKEKSKTWLWVLGWICIFPLPLTILLLRKKDMKPVLKYGIIVVAWIVYLLICFSTSNKNTADQPSIPHTTVMPSQTKSAKLETIQPTDQIKEAETVSVKETDLDIILREGHPTYYGSVALSHVIWDDVEKGRIHFGDGIYGSNDKPILSMDAYRDSDIIRLVLINFTNFEDKQTVSVDDALRVSASYLPYNIMDQYYEYKGSKMIVPDESKKNNATYYVISYRLTDAGSTAYYAKEHQYSGTIDVIIQVIDDAVQSIEITFGTPRWMGYLSKNSYHLEEWACDLYDYKN